MKVIKLKIDDKVYGRVKTAVFARKLASSYGGLVDNFTDVIIEAIADGKKEKHIYFKKDKKNAWPEYVFGVKFSYEWDDDNKTLCWKIQSKIYENWLSLEDVRFKKLYEKDFEG